MRIESLTDQELDTSTGLYNYGARLYDPVIGKFISADTIVQDPYDPQTLNRYSYCRNNPLIYVDPSGYSWLSDRLHDIGHFFSDAAEIVWQPVAQLAAASIGFSIAGPPGAAIAAASVNYAITGDPRSAVASGITAGLFYGAGELYPGNAYAHAVAGTAGGGIGAAITGGDIGRGMIVGGISGFSGTYFGSEYGLIGRSFIGGCTGGIGALIYGGNFGEGFKQGALIAGSAVIYNEWSHRLNAMKSWVRNPRVKAILSLGASKLAEYAGNELEPGFVRGVVYLTSGALANFQRLLRPKLLLPRMLLVR